MEEIPLPITADTTVLDIISRYGQTESIFKDLERETGTCICCQGLFLSLGEAAERFGFKLDRVLTDLNNAVGYPPESCQGRAGDMRRLPSIAPDRILGFADQTDVR